MSFCEQLVRKRQSSQATKILPEPSISAEGSGPLRMLPGSVAAEMEGIVNAFPKLKPPLVERLVRTALPSTPLVSVRASVETSQTLCLASYATDGSVARSYGPAGFVNFVIPGRVPLVHETPLFVEVDHPMPDDPPSKKRPLCAAATIVEPKENVSGSTTVLCWLVAFVNGSAKICVSATFADAVMVTTSVARPASASKREKRLRRGNERDCMKSPFPARCEMATSERRTSDYRNALKARITPQT